MCLPTRRRILPRHFASRWAPRRSCLAERGRKRNAVGCAARRLLPAGGGVARRLVASVSDPCRRVEGGTTALERLVVGVVAHHRFTATVADQ